MQINLDSAKSIFILGIKGVGMANLAVILKEMGKTVVGSDIEEEFITEDLLAAHNIEVIENFNPENIPQNVDLFVYSASHLGLQNPQALEAQKRGIAIVAQSALLGELMKRFKNSIAVCGCHGKTTTSSLLAYTLEKLGQDPSFFIGTSTFQDKWAGEFDEQKYFIVEADEYGVSPPDDKTAKFLSLHPSHTLCLNIDFDHPDIYKDISEIKKAFLLFFTKVPSPKLYLNADNVELMDTVKHLPKSMYKTYGFSKDADYQIHNPVISEFNSQFEILVKESNQNLGTFQISLFGMHNISNAAGVVLLLHSLGFTIEEVKQAIQNFTGAKRRFEKIAEENGVFLFDDYAHHPEEIKQTILSAKARFKDRRIIVLFQPHTYSRTDSLKDEFVDALGMADQSILLPIFASAREVKSSTTISSDTLEELARTKGIFTVVSAINTDEALDILKEKLQNEDVVFTLGAGDIYKMKNDIIEVIKSL